MTEWIDLKERKPPYDQNDDGDYANGVLAWFVGSRHGEAVGYCAAAYVDDGGGLYEFGGGRYWLADVHATHWMPLPEGPKP